MNIRGIGTVFCGGRGIDAFEQTLRVDVAEPEFIDVSGFSEPVPVRQVAPELLKDKEVLKGMRRADRLSKMAVLAAWDAWQDAGPLSVAPERTGVILATGLGPHARTFEFLDGIIDFGDAAVSPTDFSHAVHNAAAGYIATRLGCHGPVQTVTDFDFAFQQAVLLARCWLAEGRCDAVMVGTAEELADVLLHVSKRLLNIPGDGIPQPYHFGQNPAVVGGEGAAFLVLTPSGKGESYASLELNLEASTNTISDGQAPADLTILDAEGLSGDQSEYQSRTAEASLIANYLPHFGSMMTGASFQCAAAALAVRNQVLPVSPLAGTNAAPALPICRRTEPNAIQKIECLKRGRNGAWQGLQIKVV